MSSTAPAWVPRRCRYCKKWIQVGDAHCESTMCNWCKACVAQRRREGNAKPQGEKQ